MHCVLVIGWALGDWHSCAWNQLGIMELLFGLRIDGREGLDGWQHAYTRMTLSIIDGWPGNHGISIN